MKILFKITQKVCHENEREENSIEIQINGGIKGSSLDRKRMTSDERKKYEMK